MRAPVFRAAVGILCLTASAHPSPVVQKRGAEPAPPLALHEGSLEQARALALARNVPLVEVWMFETEPWVPKSHSDIERLRSDLVGDPEYARTLERAVLVLACNRVHPTERISQEGVDRERCESFHTSGCRPHQRLFEEVFARHNLDGELRSPFVLVSAPDGKGGPRWDDGSTPTKAQVLAGIRSVSKSAGKGMSPAEHLEARQLGSRAEAALESGRSGDAWHAWSALLEINDLAPLGRRASEGRRAALSQLEARRDAAEAELQAGRGLPAWRLLVELDQAARGTPLERQVARALKKLETDKRFRKEIAQAKHERAARELLNEIDALLRAGEERKADQRLRRLHKRYADTSASNEARQRWPERPPA